MTSLGAKARLAAVAGVLIVILHDVPVVRVESAEGPEPVAADAAVVHVLNRTGYGPRPGDVDRVRTLGVDTYIERQLHPERIDDTGLETRLARFRTLDLTTEEMLQRYHLPAEQARRETRQAMASTAEPSSSARTPSGQTSTQERPRPPLPEAVRRERIVLQELVAQKILRAVYSERQLEEVLVDFWFNHFNVSADKGRFIRPFLTSYERDVIRPHVLGDFRDLLGAVAESPAMLIYLDNWLSSDPDAERPRAAARRRPVEVVRRRPPQFGFGDPAGMDPQRRRGDRRPLAAVAPGRRRGMNENYARELLELHTLGVDGGYTQHDVVAVARAFTGWTIAPLQAGGGFIFEPRLHDEDEKVVLGVTFAAGGGKSDGDRVLDLLARHPATATFIATKLARRFVGDEPPAALVDRTAQRFLETGGDLRAVTRTILMSPEFHAPEARRAKVKTPLEFTASALRALDTDIVEAAPLVRLLDDMGMPLYRCQPPTGYPDRADAWVNSGALVARMNAAVDIVTGRMRGVGVDIGRGGDVAGSNVGALLDLVVSTDASDATRTPPVRSRDAADFAVLAIGSPAFQRR